jgi:hypothetical protein
MAFIAGRTLSNEPKGMRTVPVITIMGMAS